MPAEPADGEVRVPRAVPAIAGLRRVRPVWVNEVGGITFEVGTGTHRVFVKWAPPASGLDLAAEVIRLNWAVEFVCVPRVLDEGEDEEGSWMVTAALYGESAVARRWQAEPAVAVTAIGEGLRAMHEALPVASCPFSWTANDRVADAERRASEGRIDPRRWHDEHKALGLEGALAVLRDPPDIDRVVVCHGDACAPNTLMGDDGRWSGHVDLGSLGVADRWADLAVATCSSEWNYGRGWEGRLLSAYGITPDVERTRYYRLLWDLGP